MSGKNTAQGEYGGWFDDIGLTGPIRNSMDYDEIPGFVNASVFGRFSLDDLDFGDDLTKGRIDFDDEYLLKPPSSGSITFSESSAAKAETLDSYPKRDSSGGYYHPPHGSARADESRPTSISTTTSKESLETIRRQMPTVGRAIGERVFEGLEEVAGELNVDSKLLDSAKSFIDKAPTKWKLFEEQRRSSAIDRRQSVRNHQAPTESQAARGRQAALPGDAAPYVKPRSARQSGAKKRADRNTGARRRFSPIAVILIMLLIMRLVVSLFQATTDHITITHTEPEPKPGNTVYTGGKDGNEDGQFPEEIADEFTDLFNEVELWRNDNPYMSFMGLSADETETFMKAAGWVNTEVTESDDGTRVEAELDQDYSEAYVNIDSESLGFSFSWKSEFPDDQTEEEIEAAWGNLIPEDSGIYPGMRLEDLRITEEMLKAVRDYGEKNTYGDIEESSLSVNGLYIALFDGEYGWNLYISSDDTYIQFDTDFDERYLAGVYISGEANTLFG